MQNEEEPDATLTGPTPVKVHQGLNNGQASRKQGGGRRTLKAGKDPVSDRATSDAARIDLGCGLSKTEGFIGFDRFQLPGVDIVCDLDKGIPLADNSVEYVLASHFLE